MSTAVPFDPTLLKNESEDETRARHSTVEWRPTGQAQVVNDNFSLDPSLDGYVPRAGRVDRFTNSYDQLPVYVTLFEHGIVFGRTFFLCDQHSPTISSQRRYIARLSNITENLHELNKLDVSDEKVYLVGVNTAHRNHYHWTFQCLPSILLLRQEARERGLNYSIVLPPLNSARLRMLELAGVDPSECTTLEADQFISGVPMLYTSATSGQYTFQPSAGLIELLTPFVNTCLVRASDDLPTHFFLSRRDAPRNRPLDNEEKLASALSDRGYSELAMSDLSIEDQVSLFARAQSIVAAHGAGLVNLMFARPSARLIEIMPENYLHACFFRLTQMRGMGYSQVLSRVIKEDPEIPTQRSLLSVDVARVVQAVSCSEAMYFNRAA